MVSWSKTLFRAAVLAAAFSPAAGAEAPAAGAGTEAAVKVLAVPYVPQSGELCGGAAIAMVERYWGRAGVMAEDFTAWLDPGGDGILTGTMVRAVEADGWTALPVAGTPATAAAHVAEGRPVIALLQTAGDSYHYVVITAWANGWVIVHDPAVGPFRAVREQAFSEAWSGSGGWALLVLPPAVVAVPEAPAAAPVPTTAPTAVDGCEALVEAGLRLAQQGQDDDAELSFLAAEALCPGLAAPLAERAGLRFRAGDWAGATRLAERALALNPATDDSSAANTYNVHIWRLLAGSRFLAGDIGGALEAWNHLSEPRLDLTRIDGLARLRYATVADQLGLKPGGLLTPDGFRRADRRLGELPSLVDHRLSLHPQPAGAAQVDVIVLERPLVRAGPWDAGRVAVRALVGHEVSVEVASPAGRGELWTVGGRLWRERPAVQLTLAAPAVGGRPGVWRVEGLWERQTYDFPAATAVDPASGTRRVVEERRRAALSFADWPGPDLRLEAGLALDRWDDRGASLSLGGAFAAHGFDDRLSLRAEAARWVSLDGGAPFGSAGLSFLWRSPGPDGNDAWQGVLGGSRATATAPLALWQGAGTGYGRRPLLRAHPLLDGGVIVGPAFGRTFVHATVERQTWFWHAGPMACGWALFVDAARPGGSDGIVDNRWQMDGGTGLRLKSLGSESQLRFDLAHGFTDGKLAVSLDWRVPFGAAD